MTTQRWDDDRLDRIANIANSNALAIEALGHKLENTANLADSNTRAIEALGYKLENTANIADSNARAIEALGNKIESIANIANGNARIIQALANVAAEAREERQQILQVIAQQQANIEGLRTETMRMLDILLNQRNQQDNSG